jgi:hypothetical protein
VHSAHDYQAVTGGGAGGEVFGEAVPGGDADSGGFVGLVFAVDSPAAVGEDDDLGRGCAACRNSRRFLSGVLSLVVQAARSAGVRCVHVIVRPFVGILDRSLVSMTGDHLG